MWAISLIIKHQASDQYKEKWETETRVDEMLVTKNTLKFFNCFVFSFYTKLRRFLL